MNKYRQRDPSHAFTLYFLDSHSNSPDEDKYPGYAWILPSQISWYSRVANEILSSPHAKEQKGYPLAMAFFHIPLPEFDNDENIYRGKLGDKRENVSCPAYNSGFFKALKNKDVRVVVTGHDHVNDYCFDLEGEYWFS